MVGRALGGPATRRRTAHPCRRPPEETWPCALLRYGHRIDGGRSPGGNTEWRPCRGPCRECPRYGTGSAVFPRPESVGAKSATVRRGESSSSRFRRGELSPRNPASSEEHTSELQSLMRNSYAVF